MDTQETTIHQRSQTQIVKYVRTKTPHVYRTELTKTLVVKPIHLTYLTRLVISTQQRYTIWIRNLQTQQQQPRLNTVVTTINIVTHKQVVGTRTITSYLE